jgi:hypothetical protein
MGISQLAVHKKHGKATRAKAERERKKDEEAQDGGRSKVRHVIIVLSAPKA